MRELHILLFYLSRWDYILSYSSSFSFSLLLIQLCISFSLLALVRIRELHILLFYLIRWDSIFSFISAGGILSSLLYQQMGFYLPFYLSRWDSIFSFISADGILSSLLSQQMRFYLLFYLSRWDSIFPFISAGGILSSLALRLSLSLFYLFSLYLFLSPSLSVCESKGASHSSL